MRADTSIERVVIAFDGSAPARAALGVAVDEATDRGTPLHIVTAIDVRATIPLQLSIYSETARTAVHEAETWARGVLGPDRVVTTVGIGTAPRVVLHVTRKGDLLVVGTHGHRPVARMLLGSTCTALAEHAPCPVLVVRGSSTRTDAPVLVGVDGSPVSAAALRWGADEASQRRVPLRVVMALSPAVDALGFVSGPDETVQWDAQTTLDDAVKTTSGEHPGLEIERVLVETHPVEALMRHSRGAQLVVVGARGRGGVAPMLLGSVCREMLQRAPCSVLVVHAAVDTTGAAQARSTQTGRVPV